MSQILFDIIKTDNGPTTLFSNTNSQLWTDLREKIMAHIDNGVPNEGRFFYAVSYYSKSEWIIRRVEIISSVDARPRSNITISLKVPALFNKKGQRILDIFEAISRDIENKERTLSEHLLNILDVPDSNSEWHQCPQNGKYAVRTFADEKELLNLLDNLLQKDYHLYQEIYFIPQDCRFNEDESLVYLNSPIEKLNTKKFEQQTICGVTFNPEVTQKTVFDSDVQTTKIKWTCRGYKTIEKPFNNSEIRPEEVLRAIKKSDYFSISPTDASVICSIEGHEINEENGYFYIPLGKDGVCKFTISKDGYGTQEIKLSDLTKKKTIELAEKSQEIKVPFYSVSEETKKVSITILPSCFVGHECSSLVLCTSNYLESLMPKDAKKQVKQLFRNKISILIMFLFLLIGGLIGWGVTYFVMNHNPIEGNVNPVGTTCNPPDNKTQYTNYVLRNDWYKGGREEDNSLEPNGLWNAMNTYDYDNIKTKYELYKDSLNDSGKFKDVIECINNLPTKKNKGGNVNFCSDDTKPINIPQWIKKVKDANPQGTGGGGTSRGGSTSQTTTTYKCQYCEKAFNKEKEKNEHEKECSRNPQKNHRNGASS